MMTKKSSHCWFQSLIRFLVVVLLAVGGGGRRSFVAVLFVTAQPNPRNRRNRVAPKFPNNRRLTQQVQQGTVRDILKVEFARPTTAITTRPDHQDDQNNNSENDNDWEMVELDRQSDLVLQTLHGICTHAWRSIRYAPKFEARHKAYNLHCHYHFKCPDPTSSDNNEDMFSLLQQEQQQANQTTSTTTTNTKGLGTLRAIARLRQAWEQQQHHDQKEPDDDWSIVSMDAEHEEVDMEYRGTLSPSDLEPSPQEAGGGSSRKLRSNQHRRATTTTHCPEDPNDEYYANGNQSHYDTIDLSAAWQFMAQHDGWQHAAETIVHVLDSGWDMDHVDLAANPWVNPGEICNNGVDDDGNGYMDDCFGYNHGDSVGNTHLLGHGSHGSHVAGTIAANTDNGGLGVAGVAGGAHGGTGIRLMTSVGFGQTNTAGFAEALVYAVDMGAHISSNSWGYAEPNVYEPDVVAALQYALDHDVLVLFAAGNSNSNASYYPAVHPHVVAVAATNVSGRRRASFSNYGTWTDIAAPGVHIWSTGTNNQYLKMSGTSMACPHVAGVVAMGKSLRPQSTVSDVKTCLFDTALPLDDDRLEGTGMVNPTGFLQCLVEAYPETSLPTVRPSSTPSTQPTNTPTVQPSSAPSPVPSVRPSMSPSSRPSQNPSHTPTTMPLQSPSTNPSKVPSTTPSTQPSFLPSTQPTETPTTSPQPTISSVPSSEPSDQPSQHPSCTPSNQPSETPTLSSHPSVSPSSAPSNNPSSAPSSAPTLSTQPSQTPSSMPSDQPTLSTNPSAMPSESPSTNPSQEPSSTPSNAPSVSTEPSAIPSGHPSTIPSWQPSPQPSMVPSTLPSTQPSSTPTVSTQPSVVPSFQPSSTPTISSRPSSTPSHEPSSKPSILPSQSPTSRPSKTPSNQPSSHPSQHPTLVPSSSPNPTLEPSTATPTSTPTTTTPSL